MGLFWTESFESNNLGDKINANGTVVSSWSANTGNARTGSWSSISTYTITLGSGDRDDLIVVGGAFRIGSPANAEHLMFTFNGDGFNQVLIYLNKTSSSAFTIRAKRGDGTLLGESASLFLPPTGTYVYFEAKVRIHDTTGTVDVQYDGSSVLSVSGVDTHQGGASGLVDLITWSHSFSTNEDDLYACNEQGSTNTDFLGVIRVEALAPSGNGATSNGVGSDGNSTDNYLLVDEAVPDSVSTADYVDFNATGDKDTYAHGDSTLPTGNSVKGVFVWAYAQKTDAGTRSLTPLARLSGTESSGATLPLINGTYKFVGDVFQTKPGGGAWAVADVNNAEFGVKAS